VEIIFIVFEMRHIVHDSSSCDFCVLWVGLRVVRVGSKNCAKLAGRVGSQNLDLRATLAQSFVCVWEYECDDSYHTTS